MVPPHGHQARCGHRRGHLWVIGRCGGRLRPSGDPPDQPSTRKAAPAGRIRGLGKPATFDFLGFTHFCGTRRDGTGFVLGRKPVRKRMRARLRAIREMLRRRLHDEVAATGRWLGRVVRGWFAYFAVPGSMRWLTAFRHWVVQTWLAVLRRRSQKHRMTWGRIASIANRFLPQGKRMRSGRSMRRVS